MIVIPVKDVVQVEGYSQPTKVLSKGRKYIVLAIQKDQKGRVEYFIIEDIAESDPFPKPHSEKLFEVLDRSLPADWVETTEGLLKKMTYITFPDWSRDFSGFYNELADNDAEACELLKNKMEEYGFYRQKHDEDYQEDLRLAKERGYEWPVKPE